MANRDINDFFKLFLDVAVPVKSAFANSAHPGSECARLNASSFAMMHELMSWWNVSLLVQMGTALEVPKLGGSTRPANH